jgi:hypothetical protein
MHGDLGYAESEKHTIFLSAIPERRFQLQVKDFRHVLRASIICIKVSATKLFKLSFFDQKL